MEYCRHASGAGQRDTVMMPSLHMTTPATMHIHARWAAAEGTQPADQQRDRAICQLQQQAMRALPFEGAFSVAAPLQGTAQLRQRRSRRLL